MMQQQDCCCCYHYEYSQKPVVYKQPCERANDWERESSRRLKTEKKADRQRIHQLIKLLDLPDEIKEAVRDGTLTEIPGIGTFAIYILGGVQHGLWQK